MVTVLFWTFVTLVVVYGITQRWLLRDYYWPLALAAVASWVLGRFLIEAGGYLSGVWDLVVANFALDPLSTVIGLFIISAFIRSGWMVLRRIAVILAPFVERAHNLLLGP